MKWARQINAAIANDGIELLAQPIVPLRTDGPTQYELLLRMRDEHGSLISPGSFLYVAERLGLIREIDRWVTERAIGMLAEQRAAGRDLRFEVNLSGYTIGDDQLLELIERRLAETGVPADRLIFEITETAAIENITREARFADRLSELGCRFALDDFGAGRGRADRPRDGQVDDRRVRHRSGDARRADAPRRRLRPGLPPRAPGAAGASSRGAAPYAMTIH